MSAPLKTGSPPFPQDLTPLQTTALETLPAMPKQPSTNPRRLPPPCWTPDETVALIDAYRDKWYTLRRGNLKANHWQEVADAVGRRCPASSPPKTAVQCRHKMEKLRKRYRTEIQRARSMPDSRFTSSWVHFKRMDAMEKGPQAKADYSSESEGDDNDDDNEDDGDIRGSYLDNYRNGNNVMNTRSIQKLYRNGIGNPGCGGDNNGLNGGNSSLGSSNAGGFRIRIPTGVSIAQPGPKFYAQAEQKHGGSPNMGVNASPNPYLKPKYGGGVGASGRVMRGSEEMGKKREREPMEELVAAVKVLGDGFVRMEQMKMEMAREMETMRMEMEMKRTEMFLESQQRIVEAFAKTLSKKKKKRPKRMPLPES
ncbi:TRIHELIX TRANSCRIPTION FACTOR ASIL2 [Salix purpurea]|uniref:TRIHELIX TRANSCRIPTION FACTOR ASIL2 n=1 Tax=Salix purpurea TaxID=77065 RepID=A0A9Q0PDI4_SALPP|nr:TRIHELIX TRANSCRIPTION FACTOR ASIL2 [Salix purpurea]